MGMIVIRCPNTGREISTGLEADRRAFQGMPVFFSRTYCPICRTNHEWFAKDARIRDEERRAPTERLFDAPRTGPDPEGGAGAKGVLATALPSPVYLLNNKHG